MEVKRPEEEEEGRKEEDEEEEKKERGRRKATILGRHRGIGTRDKYGYIPKRHTQFILSAV